MEIINPRPKKFGKFLPNVPLPAIREKFRTSAKINCKFNEFSVHINDPKDIKLIFEMGFFGKGNFSRSYPQYNNEKPDILRIRQYDKRMEWASKNPLKFRNNKKIIIVQDSDGEYEDYFNELQPVYSVDRSGMREVLFLSLEEAFFLAYCVEALAIEVESQYLDSDTLWASFSKCDPYFVCNYVAYNYFRTKNWIVKPGIKFGGDFLLYKEGPSYYHASYVVILDVFHEGRKRVEALTKRSMDNISLLCLNRLCETAGKELMVCEITLPEEVDYKDLTNVTIKEIIINRCSESIERS